MRCGRGYSGQLAAIQFRHLVDQIGHDSVRLRSPFIADVAVGHAVRPAGSGTGNLAQPNLSGRGAIGPRVVSLGKAFFGRDFLFSTVARLRNLATVFGLMPSSSFGCETEACSSRRIAMRCVGWRAMVLPRWLAKGSHHQISGSNANEAAAQITRRTMTGYPHITGIYSGQRHKSRRACRL